MTEKPTALWQEAIAFLGGFLQAREPLDRDRGPVEELLAELYLLGERPSADELRSYVQSLRPRPPREWEDAVIELWKRRLKKPAFHPPSTNSDRGWAYPFGVPESCAADHGLTPIPERLASAISDAALAYVEQMERQPESQEALDAAGVFELTARAVRLYALSRDRVDDRGFPSVTKRPRGRDNLYEQWTRVGRARAEARLAESIRRRDEEEACWREHRST